MSSYREQFLCIPHGSALSVILFQIAFNEISKIISANRFVDHCLYADDLYILCKKIVTTTHIESYKEYF